MNSLSKEQVIECYLKNSQKVLAELLYDTITRYESRKCSNCKHWSREYENNGICAFISCQKTDYFTSDKFGCNRFENIK